LSYLSWPGAVAVNLVRSLRVLADMAFGMSRVW